MEYRRLDMSAYPRLAHFRYFSAMANPYAGVTKIVDVTDFYHAVKSKNYSFFLCFLYAAVRAANAVPELRRRIRDGGIVEYDDCPASYTVLREDETYCYCSVTCERPLSAFLPYAAARQEAAIREASLSDGEDALPLLFVSCLPWLDYTALLQPTPSPPDSNPRITWGRFTETDGRVTLPVTLLCHHALADGLHIARFYEALERKLDEIAREF